MPTCSTMVGYLIVLAQKSGGSPISALWEFCFQFGNSLPHRAQRDKMRTGKNSVCLLNGVCRMWAWANGCDTKQTQTWRAIGCPKGETLSLGPNHLQRKPDLLKYPTEALMFSEMRASQRIRIFYKGQQMIARPVHISEGLE